jgi:hypothetical protein
MLWRIEPFAISLGFFGGLIKTPLMKVKIMTKVKKKKGLLSSNWSFGFLLKIYRSNRENGD